MNKKSSKRTLLIYLAYAFLISSVLTTITLLIEFNPSTKGSFKRFGIGAATLNSVLWSLIFTVTGSTSLFNQNDSVHKNFLLSLLCFLFLPSLVAIVVLLAVDKPGDLFGFTEAAIVFFITQLFFFFRFRSCMKRPNMVVID